MSSTQQNFDITIVGGGMVGLTMAELAAAEFPTAKICLIEQETFSQSDELYQPGFDARNTALSPGSTEVFAALGFWQQMRERATPILSVHVSDKGHFGTTEFSSVEYHNEALGYVIENAWMGRCLINALKKFPNIEVLAPAKVTGISLKKMGANLQVEHPEKHRSFDSDLVIIADGANSTLRTQLGISLETKNYQQSAVIANLECSEAHQGQAFERFTSEGPVALLPLGYSANSRRCALVYTRPDELLAETLALSDEDFLAQVQAAFGYRAGRFIKTGKRYAYPLNLSFAKEQVRSSVVLLGNAAHFLHPVAGQGFNLALRDATQLLAALKPAYASKERGEPGPRFGDLALLQNYLTLQERDQNLTTLISDSFNQLFSNNSKVKQLGRNVGLLALDLHDGLKREVFHRMMGESLMRAPLKVYENALPI